MKGAPDEIWTYRRLLSSQGVWDFDHARMDDVTMQNWEPGNDYPYGSFLKNKSGAQAERSDWYGGIVVHHLEQAELHAMAFYFYMKEHTTHSWDTRFLRGSDPMNMMGTQTGLARFPYVRGTRRIVGLYNFRITERSFVDTHRSDYPGGTSYRFFDAVGIGNYAADVHESQTSTGIRPSKSRPAPFYLPYRALASHNVRNLLAGGKSLAVTYITNSAYRLHPIEWVIGSATGYAAAQLSSASLSNYQLLELPHLRSLQTVINSNSPISWAAYDTTPIPPYDGDLVINDRWPLLPGVAFEVELFCPGIASALLTVDGQDQGTSTTLRHGAVIHTHTLTSTGNHAFLLRGYDSQGSVICQHSAVAKASRIIDNDSPHCSSQGVWTRAASQANRYGSNYDYAWGSAGLSTFTYSFTVPQTGAYRVEIWYPHSYNRSEQAPFTITHAGGSHTVTVNQKINGGVWNSLGVYTFNQGQGYEVTLSNSISNPNELVVADALRVVPAGK